MKELSSIQFGLRASRFRNPADPKRTGLHSRGYLPHVKREGAFYFVTFRLGDSLPQSILKQFEHEVAKVEQDDARRQEMRKRIERYLDSGAGGCFLAKPEIAELASNALTFWNGSRYVLRDWVVMPNHIHVWCSRWRR
jgi:putative transposase